LESAYEECLHYELDKIGLIVIKQKPMPLIYEGKKLDLGYRIDLFVENKVIIEIKSVDALNPVHFAQLMTYLKLSNRRIGFLINFNVQSLKDGIKRVIIENPGIPSFLRSLLRELLRVTLCYTVVNGFCFILFNSLINKSSEPQLQVYPFPEFGIIFMVILKRFKFLFTLLYIKISPSFK
jgi:GxxExxY protein